MSRFDEYQEYATAKKGLSDLYPAGTALSEVAPDFRGLGFAQYRMLKISEQCSAISKRWWAQFANGETPDAPLSKKAIWTPRDDYGMKGFRGR